MLKLYINENMHESINDADKEFIVDTLSDVTRMSSNVPFDKFSSIRWLSIIKDVRRILFGKNESPYVRTLSIEDNLKDEGYDNPEEELYNVLRDALDDIEEHGHNSVNSCYANSLNLLLRGQLFQW